MGDLLRSLPSLLAVWPFPWLPLPFAFRLLVGTLLFRRFASAVVLLAGMSSGVLVTSVIRRPLGRGPFLPRSWTRRCRLLAFLSLELIVPPRSRLLPPPLRGQALCLLADRLLRLGFPASTFPPTSG